MLYRIFTEDTGIKGRKNVASIVGKQFDGFTLLQGTGYWKGTKEKSMVVEIVARFIPRKVLNSIVDNIKTVNRQQACLVQTVKNHAYLR